MLFSGPFFIYTGNLVVIVENKKELKFNRSTLFFLSLFCLFSHSLIANGPAQKLSDVQWEYAQFISQENVYQWIEQDLLVTTESQQALLRRMGVPPSTEGQQFINDLIVLNHVGALEWELVSIVNSKPGTLIYTFKRMISNTD